MSAGTMSLRKSYITAAFILVLTAVAMAFSARHAAMAESAASTDEVSIKAVLLQYKSAIERLDASGTERLFAPDAQIFEQGGREGNYQNYLAHHLGPELAEFASFRFDNYDVSVHIDRDTAVVAESYTYRIVLKSGGDPVDRVGVATSVLKRTASGWLIVQSHSSSRKPPATPPAK